MNIRQVSQYVAQKVGRFDSYAQGIALNFAVIRHRHVYDAFDWKSAQVTVTINIPFPDPNDVHVSGVDKIISVRYKDRFLDPVVTQFIFDTRPELLDATGEPEFYTETYDQSSGTRSIKLFPRPGTDQLGTDGTGVDLLILGKRPLDATGTEILPQVPYIESAFIAYVEADMLSWLRQYAKAKEVLAIADALLEQSKAMDTPAAARPRQGKVLTVSGNSLDELTDSVCDIIGKWEPQIRISVKEKIRRNWQTLWEMALWPESTVVARVTATDREQLVLPYVFDRVIAVRPDDNSIQQLRNVEISLFFNIDPQIFEREDDPVYFSMISPSATAVLPPYTEPITCVLITPESGGRLVRHPSFNDEIITVFFKGEGGGVEASEEITVHTAPPTPGPSHIQDFINAGGTTTLSYDIPLTLSKPPTIGELRVYGALSQRLLLVLSPQERERKHIRIWLLPNRRAELTLASSQSSGTTPDLTPKTYLVLGKRKMSPLVSDNDTCQLRNVENILINGAAADMLMSSDVNLANVYRQKAGELVKALVDGETNQNAYEPTITPYVEPSYRLR